MKDPLVSVTMVNRNYGHFMHHAIESVTRQNYRRWELIVVENGSTDDSRGILEKWVKREPRIRSIFLPKSLPLPAARNAALNLASGEYVAILDSDDQWMEDRLSRQIDVLERRDGREIAVCGSNCWLINEKDETTGRKEFPLAHEQCVRALWRRNPFCHSATLIRRSYLDQAGFYDERFAVAHDLELWLRLGWRFRFCNLPEYLVKYRIWPANITFTKHRTVVRNSVSARSRALSKYRGVVGWKERLTVYSAWFAQWMPPAAAHLLFNRLVLGSRRPVERTSAEHARIRTLEPKRMARPTKRLEVTESQT